MKKFLSLILVAVFMFLVGCNNQKPNDHYSSSAIASTGETSKTSKDKITEKAKESVLYEYAPTVKEYLRQLLDEGIIKDDTKIEYSKGDEKYCSLIYLNEGKFKSREETIDTFNAGYFTLYIYYDDNDVVYKIRTNLINENGDRERDKPITIYLKSFPNSLSDQEKMLEYLKENGEFSRKEYDEVKYFEMLVDKSAHIYTFAQNNIEYKLSTIYYITNHDKIINNNYVEKEIEINLLTNSDESENTEE